MSLNDSFSGLFGPFSGKGLALVSSILDVFRNIPYENISKINSEPCSLRMPDVIMREYEEYGLGGTCFSITWLLREVLREFGTDADICMADRTYAEDAHCALVFNDGNSKYLLDPGYLIFRPILIPEDGNRIDFTFGDGRFYMERDGSCASLYSSVSADFSKFRYRLKLRAVSVSEFFGFWQRSFSFAMMNYVIVNKYIDGKLFYLKNTCLHEGRDRVVHMTPEETSLWLDSAGISGREFLKAFEKGKKNA